MKIYIKIWCLFLVASLLLTGVGLAINRHMQQQYNEKMLLHMKNSVLNAADTLQEQLKSVSDQLLTLSVSSQANLFSIYQPEKDWNLIYEKTNLLYQHLNIFKQGYAYVQNAFLLFPAQNRQITDSLRYEELDSSLYNMLTDSSDEIRIDGDRLFLHYMLSTNHVNKSGAIAGAELSMESLLEHCLSAIMPQTQIRLSVGQYAATETSQWIPEENGWTMQFPILLNSKGGTMLLEVFLHHNELYGAGTAYTVWYAIFILIMVTLLALFGWMVRNIVARPIRKILDSFDAVAQGNTTVRIHETAMDEFEDIYRHFNNSVEKLHSLLVREYQAQMAAQRAEIKHLQTQIQPHFLYNAFYQMYWICKMEGCDQAAEYALLVSGYYEYITRTRGTDNNATLAEEIEHARKYIQIQEIRFGDRFNVCIETDDACLDTPVPKLVLQPVIENAVKHCVEKDVHCHLTLRLSVRTDEDRTVLVIEDDGKMLSDADIERQRQRLAGTDPVDGGSGLSNVHLRLKLSGRCSGLELSRSGLGGLRVMMTLINSQTDTLR